MTILVTGGAGFIGGNFVLDWVADNNELVINLDKLTYALCVLSVWLAFYLRLGEFFSLVGQPMSLVFSPVLIAALVSVLTSR